MGAPFSNLQRFCLPAKPGLHLKGKGSLFLIGTKMPSGRAGPLGGQPSHASEAGSLPEWRGRSGGLSSAPMGFGGLQSWGQAVEEPPACCAGSLGSEGLVVAAPRGKTNSFLVPFPNHRKGEGLFLDLCRWLLHKEMQTVSRVIINPLFTQQG